MSLTWDSYSTPDTGLQANGVPVVHLSGEYDFSPTYEDTANIDCVINFSEGHGLSQQDMLDMLTPVYDALVNAGWVVGVHQDAVVERWAV